MHNIIIALHSEFNTFLAEI